MKKEQSRLDYLCWDFGYDLRRVGSSETVVEKSGLYGYV